MGSKQRSLARWIAILEQAYGKPSKKLKQLVNTMNYSKLSLAEAEKRDSQKAEEKDVFNWT